MMQLYQPAFAFACLSVMAVSATSPDEELGPEIYGMWIMLWLWLTAASIANLI